MRRCLFLLVLLEVCPALAAPPRPSRLPFARPSFRLQRPQNNLVPAPGAPAVQPAGSVKLRSITAADVPHLQGSIRGMESFILTVADPHYFPNEPGSTPAMEMHPVPGTPTRLRLTRSANLMDEFNQNAHAVYEVVGSDPQGTVALDLLMPVSGHAKIGSLTKNQTAQQYARTNQYVIQVIHPGGRVERLGGIASQGLVTLHRLELTLEKGTTRVQFYPQGSQGVTGYWTGRTIDLVRN